MYICTFTLHLKNNHSAYLFFNQELIEDSIKQFFIIFVCK